MQDRSIPRTLGLQFAIATPIELGIGVPQQRQTQYQYHQEAEDEEENIEADCGLSVPGYWPDDQARYLQPRHLSAYSSDSSSRPSRAEVTDHLEELRQLEENKSGAVYVRLLPSRRVSRVSVDHRILQDLPGS